MSAGPAIRAAGATLRAGRKPAIGTTLWLVVAVALLLRALVPLGFMPVRAPAGDIALAICSGHGPVDLVDPVPSPTDEQPDDSAMCPYALATPTAQAVEASGGLAALLVQPGTACPRPPTRAPPGTPRLAHAPSTGPPLTA